MDSGSQKPGFFCCRNGKIQISYGRRLQWSLWWRISVGELWTRLPSYRYKLLLIEIIRHISVYKFISLLSPWVYLDTEICQQWVQLTPRYWFLTPFPKNIESLGKWLTGTSLSDRKNVLTPKTKTKPNRKQTHSDRQGRDKGTQRQWKATITNAGQSEK